MVTTLRETNARFDTREAHKVVQAQVAALLADENPMPAVPCELAAIERYWIIETLRHAKGNVALAARILGVSTRTIQYRLVEWRGVPRCDLSNRKYR